MFKTIKYISREEFDPLITLLDSALQQLKGSINEFTYPDDLKRSNNKDMWKFRYKEIDNMNVDIMSAISGKSGVYAILSAQPNERWVLQYIGQAKSSVSKQRIRSHLVWRNKDTKSGRFTGSKFDEVQQALRAGNDIALSFIEISPASLRHYVEEMLIDKMQPAWNLNGTTAQRQRVNRMHCSW
ncbi:hypothetical protein [Duganella sp. LjRoot269]|uniref:hypothetical protein n=1 Tax=Duganella sp. LjRoot269 TaxID=3342305 RepID=UPI003ECCE6BB